VSHNNSVVVPFHPRNETAAGGPRDTGRPLPGQGSDRYLMDGNKMLWHLDRVAAWQRGERIAPLHIDVGLSKGCNIKCRYCYGITQANAFRRGRERVFPREPLLAYMRDAGELGVRSIALIGEAEPTLNPALYEAVVTGRKAGADMAVGTNGILWDTGRAGQEALEHLTWIRFNISAASDHAYRRVHASKDFATAIDKIRFCVRHKRRQGLDVTVGLQMVLTSYNVDQAVPLARLGAELGVDYLVIKQCSDTVRNDLGVYAALDQYADYTEVLEEAAAVGEGNPDYSVIVKWNKILNRGQRDYHQCLGVPFLLYSSGDGRLYPCGMFFDDREEEFRMGDLVETSFKRILESDRYWAVVERVRERIDVHRECYSNCRTHSINDFLWRIRNPPAHVNFV